MKNILYKIKDWIFGSKSLTLEESVNELLKEHDQKESIVETEMLRNFVDFKAAKLQEVMIPRTEVVYINHDTTFKALKNIFIECGHTRLPVCKNSVDEAIGFVHMKDFITYIGKEEEFSIQKIMRNLLYAPKSILIIDLLSKMRESGIHIAVVLDEYGGMEGIATIEDLVEEIVGEIRDEHDEVSVPKLIIMEGDNYLVDGKAKIEEVESELDIEISNDDDDFETFGGLILSFLGRVPHVGEIILHTSGINIEILEGDSRRVKKTKVSKIK